MQVSKILMPEVDTKIKNLPVRGLLMRFLSFRRRFNDDDVDVIEAEDEEGDDIVDSVDEVDDLCKSMGEGLSPGSTSPLT